MRESNLLDQVVAQCRDLVGRGAQVVISPVNVLLRLPCTADAHLGVGLGDVQRGHALMHHIRRPVPISLMTRTSKLPAPGRAGMTRNPTRVLGATIRGSRGALRRPC